MFDHLDDPQSWEPDDVWRESIHRRGRSLRRRRRLAAGGAVAVVLLVAGVAGASALVDRKLDSVERIDVAGLRQTAKPVDPKVLLFVGADSDAGLTPDPRPAPYRTDTIVLVRVDPGQQTLTVLPLPRDLWVDIAGHGKGRINQAFALGGPALLIDTIHRNLGIEVDHYLQADFEGTIDIGNAVGGLRLAFDTDVRDAMTGLHTMAGCTTFDGTGLLQLGRARHLQYRQGDRWVPDPTSDIGRIERQQVIGEALLGRLAALDTGDPAQVARLISSISSSLVVDDHTTSSELIGLFRAITGSRYVPLRLPVADAVHGGAQVLEPQAGTAGVVEDFLDAPPPPTPHHGPGGMPNFETPVLPTPC